MKRTSLLLVTLMLSSCLGHNEYQPDMGSPAAWQNGRILTGAQASPESLKGWWERFQDPALNELIGLALAESPDRRQAEALIAEARGIRKTARSALFPQIGASANAGRADNGVGPDDTYDAGFDASYELDIFGRNRNTASAAERNIRALEENYHDVTLTLIGEISRLYMEMRGYQKQVEIAESNLVLQEKTLELVRQLVEAGESPQLDVERSETLVNTTRASIPEFKRQKENTQLALSVLVGKMPEDIAPIVEGPALIPASNAAPLLMTPADVIAGRPDVKAAIYTLEQYSDLTQAEIADIFPTVSLSGFYGVAETALVSSTTIWSVAAGAAVSLLDFGRIQGDIDAASAREAQAYEAYRRTVLEAVTEVESALNDYAQLNERRIALYRAYESADRAFTLSETLYREGEISFLDVLDSQRTVNESEAAFVTAESLQAQALVRLYKALGVGL